MSYQISHLDLRSVENRTYFFDANIWLLILGIKTNPSAQEVKYMQFFADVFASAKKGQARIVLPALLVSEIVNRMILNVEMPKFAKAKGEDHRTPNYLKIKFRPAPEYQKAREKIHDDLNIYASVCQQISDNFGSPGFACAELLDPQKTSLEFGDNYFYRLAAFHEAVLVTHDGDFFFQDLPIYTLNNQLLERAKAALAPK